MKMMTPNQKGVIQEIFRTTSKTYHRLADEAGIGQRPDKFEDLSCDMARKIIDVQMQNHLKETVNVTWLR